MPAMRSQVSSLLQNGLKFGIENRRGNWNSLIRGCRVLVISPLLLPYLRTWPTACPSRPSCQKPPTSHRGARGSGRAGGVVEPVVSSSTRVTAEEPDLDFQSSAPGRAASRVDVPEEHKAGRSLPGQHASRYMCAIFAAFVPSPTGLDHGEYQLTLCGKEPDGAAMFCLGSARQECVTKHFELS